MTAFKSRHVRLLPSDRTTTESQGKTTRNVNCGDNAEGSWVCKQSYPARGVPQWLAKSNTYGECGLKQ